MDIRLRARLYRIVYLYESGKLGNSATNRRAYEYAKRRLAKTERE